MNSFSADSEEEEEEKKIFAESEQRGVP